MFRVLAISVAVLGLALSGCQRTPTDPNTPGTPGEPTPTMPAPEVVSGTIEQWIGREAVLRAYGYNPTAGEVVIAEGDVSADGRFSLTLPVGQGVAGALSAVDNDSFCDFFNEKPDEDGGEDTIEVTPAPVDTTIVAFLVYGSVNSPDNEPIGDLLLTDDTYSVGITYRYAAADVAIRGECITTYPNMGDTVTNRYDLALKAGWNRVAQSSMPTGSSYATEPIPSETCWSFFER